MGGWEGLGVGAGGGWGGWGWGWRELGGGWGAGGWFGGPGGSAGTPRIEEITANAKIDDNLCLWPARPFKIKQC
jgi:hypothetical protein